MRVFRNSGLAFVSLFLLLAPAGAGPSPISGPATANYEHWANLYLVDIGLAYGEAFSLGRVRRTGDGGLAIGFNGSGSSASWYGEQLGVLRLDPWGHPLWSVAPLSCGDGGECSVRSLAVLSDGRIAVLATYIESWDSSLSRVVLMMLGPKGAVKWIKAFTGNYYSSGYYDLQPTRDGGLLIAAALAGGHWVARLAPAGRIVWQARLDAAIFALQQTPDGGFIAAGVSGGELGDPSSDAWIAKFTAGGAIAWQKSLGDPLEADNFHRVVVTGDGYLAAGETRGFTSSQQDVWAVKFDPSGHVLWQRAIGRWTTGALHTLTSLAPSRDGASLLFGYVGPYENRWSAECGFAVKLSASGNLIWSRRLPSTIEDGIELLGGDVVFVGEQILGGTCFPVGSPQQEYVFAARLNPRGVIGMDCCLVEPGDLRMRSVVAIPYRPNFATIHSPAQVRNLSPNEPGFKNVLTTNVCQADPR